MNQASRLRTLLRLIPWVALLALSLDARAELSATPDPFQRGWSAYDQGDYAGAIQFWLPLAEQGHVNAQINLGVMYDHGYGVDQDFERAARWYQAAARQNSATAQYNLGMFLAERKMHIPGAEDALHWLRMAATQGHADAQYELGLMYADGAAGQAGMADAPRWLFQAGLNYLSSDDGEGAHSAVTALQKVADGQQLAQELETRLANWSKPTQGSDGGAPPSSVSTGTAWPVAAGYAVTNHHVVSGKQSLVLVNREGEQIPATVIATDETHDVALLHVGDAGKLPPALPLAADAARLGTSVFTIGFPRVDTMGTTPKLSLGIISSVNGLQDDPSSYQISVPIQPGNSGGPLINMHGEVVGVITSMLGMVDSANGDPQPLPNINYALKAGVLESLLREVPAQPSTHGELATGLDSLEALADKIQGSVMIVRAR